MGTQIVYPTFSLEPKSCYLGIIVKITIDESEKEQTREFYKKYKRNFFIKKHKKSKIYVLYPHSKWPRNQDLDDGTPMIGINLHHRKTNTTEYQILVLKENVIVWF